MEQRRRIQVSTTLCQPTLCCLLETMQRSFRPYRSHVLLTADNIIIQITRRHSLDSCTMSVGTVCSIVLSVYCGKFDCTVKTEQIMNISINCVTRLFQMFSLIECMCCWPASRVVVCQQAYGYTKQNNDLKFFHLRFL